MKTPTLFTSAGTGIRKLALLGIASLLLAGALPQTARAAACAMPSPGYGVATGTITVPSTATYRLWSRLMAPTSTSNSYLLEVDGKECFNVGGASMTNNVWTWVDYKDGNKASKVEMNLSQGTHNVKFIGSKPDVRLDRLMVTSDLACVPSATGNGDDCNAPTSDKVPPTVTLTAPAEGSTVSGFSKLTATASDNVGIVKVEFYLNSTLIATEIKAPYDLVPDWDTTKYPNGTHVLSARAYDAAGNVSPDSYNITIRNGDNAAPSTPTGVTATATAFDTVRVGWQPSTDNVGVKEYRIVRDGFQLATIPAMSGTAYVDSNLLPSTTYTYRVTAYDTAGNASVASASVSATTPRVPDVTAPTVPTGMTATAVTSSQINLSWNASTDAVGVAGYDVYRQNSNGTVTRVAQLTPRPSFGDASLAPGTTYTYYVVAVDAAGNRSANSAKVSAKTLAKKPTGAIIGRTLSSITDKPTAYVTVATSVNGVRQISTSNRAGEYALRDLSAGNYNVTYSKSVYYPQTLTIKVQDGTVTRDVTLQAK